MKRKMRPVLITLIILAVLTGVGIYFLLDKDTVSDSFKERIQRDQSDQEESRAYRFDIDEEAIELKISGDDKNVLNFDSDNVYDVAASKDARDRLDRLIRRMTTSFDEPIIAANPFGTNTGSFYFYFESSYRGMLRYTVTVEDETVFDHVRYVNNGQEENLTEKHEFVVSGLVPGKTNYIILEILDSNGARREKRVFKYTMPAAKGKTQISMEKGNSKSLCCNGMFFVFPKSDKNIYAYDHNGVLRNTIVTETGHGRRMYQAGDCVLYQISDTKVVKVSALGQVLGVAEIKGYGAIKDFAYDGYENIYALVTKKGKDYLIATSLTKGKTKETFVFPKKVKVTSVAVPTGGSVYAVCQAPQGIMRIDALTSQTPQVNVVYGKKKDWKKTAWKKKVVPDEQVVCWDLSGVKLNLLTAGEQTNSMAAYVSDKGTGTGLWFTMDNDNKKISVEHSFPVNEEGRCDCQAYDSHVIISNLTKGNFAEYDQLGKVTRSFSFGLELDAITKLSLNDMCFYSGQ